MRNSHLNESPDRRLIPEDNNRRPRQLAVGECVCSADRLGFLTDCEDLFFGQSGKTDDPLSETAVPTRAAGKLAGLSFSNSDHLVCDPQCLVELTVCGQR